MIGNPQDAPGWYRLGNEREDQGRDAEALECFERAVAMDPKHAKAWNNLGAASQRLGDLPRAEGAYRTALAQEPSLLQPNLNLGRLHEGRGENAEAATCYSAALAHHPRDEMLAHLLAAVSGRNTERAPRQFVQALFDEQAPRFEEHLVKDLEYRIPGLLAGMVRPALARRPVRVLDLGCGTGLVGAALAGNGIELSGVDLSAGMLQQAAKRGIYAQLEQSDVQDALAACAEASLAAVVAADVFIYIGELREIFAATSRSLAAEGVFAFSIEALDSGSYRLQPSGRYAHALDYVRALAEECGMTVERVADARIRRQGDGYATGSVVLMRKA